MTGLDLLSGSLRLIGVLAAGESLSANESTDALISLNHLLDSWSNEELIALPVLRETFALSTIGLSETYAWGSGAAMNSARPMSVKRALIQLTGTAPPVEMPMTILNMEQYSAVVLKSLQSTFPLYCYIDDAYPSKNVSVWPVPTDSTNSLVFYSTKPLTPATLSAALSLPPGYLRSLRFNLAVDLAPEYGRAVSPEVASIAIESKAEIKRTNTKPSYLLTDTALVGQPSVYNWRTDGHNR